MRGAWMRIFLWVRHHEKHLVVSFVAILTTVSGFFFGFYAGAAHRAQPMLTVVRGAAERTVTAENHAEATAPLTAGDCKFVGSTKGTKYYPPTCSYAKKIRKENLRCFTSERQAEDEGYTRSTSCT